MRSKRVTADRGVSGTSLADHSETDAVDFGGESAALRLETVSLARKLFKSTHT
jgi:hypothetical protein